MLSVCLYSSGSSTGKNVKCPTQHIHCHRECRAGTELGGKDRTGPDQSFFVVQDRAEAAVLGEQRIATVAEEVQVERLVGLLLAVALDFDGDGLRRLAGGV
jgi:hypothetical protein